MDKKADKKWKCLYLLSVVAFVISLIFAGSWLMSEPGQVTDVKKAMAVLFFVLSIVGTLVAKIGSWFFHD
jgi:hypothetical protein